MNDDKDNSVVSTDLAEVLKALQNLDITVNEFREETVTKLKEFREETETRFKNIDEQITREIAEQLQ